MTNQQLAENILAKYYRVERPNAEDFAEYTEYVFDMNRAELEFENTLIAECDA